MPVMLSTKKYFCLNAEKNQTYYQNPSSGETQDCPSLL